MKTLFEALSKFQSQLESASKDSVNPHFKSKYADLAECWNAIREPLGANGLAVSQLLSYENDKYTLTTKLTHASGEFIESTMPLLLTKQDMQGLGAATTYARRFMLCSILGITQEDDDGETAVGRGMPKAAVKVAESTALNLDNPVHKVLVSNIAKELNLIDRLKEDKGAALVAALSTGKIKVTTSEDDITSLLRSCYL